MARKPYDPLHFVPSPDVVREKLQETMTLAERLRLLLELAVRMRLPVTTGDKIDTPSGVVKAK